MFFRSPSFNPILPFLMLAADHTAVLVSHIDNSLQPLHFLPLPRKEGGVPDIEKDRVSENKHCCHRSILFRFCLAALSFSLSLLLRLNMCLRKNLAAGTESKQTLVHTFRNDAKLNILGSRTSYPPFKLKSVITIMPLVLWPFTSVNS